MACGSCGKKKVAYQVKVDGRPVGSPQASVDAAHALGRKSAGPGQKYTFTAVKASMVALLLLLALPARDERGAVSADWLAKLFRQPNLVLAVIGGFINMLVLLDVWDLTGEQVAGINAFFVALVALVAFVVTPSSEVVARQRGDGPVKAGKKAENAWGIVEGRTVEVTPAVPPPPAR